LTVPLPKTSKAKGAFFYLGSSDLIIGSDVIVVIGADIGYND
jgi:hypothetical protein